MKTLERVNKYRDAIAAEPEIASFSIGAFVFNSFYFFYHDIGSWFLAAFLTPVLITALFIIVGHPLIGVILGLLLPRVILGFLAPEIIRRHQVKYIETFKDVTPEAAVNWFSVSSLRLVALSIVSAGLYQIYWAYKNWKAIKEATKEDITPVMRSWFFGIFFIYPLFRRVAAALPQQLPVSRCYRFSAVVYTLFYVAGTLVSFDMLKQLFPENIEIVFFWYLAVFLMPPFFLVPILHRMNALNHLAYPDEKPRQGFLLGEKLTVICGFVILIFGLCNFFSFGFIERHDSLKLLSLPQAQQDAIEELNIIYSLHVEEYNTFCTAAGYPLQKYPQAFKAKTAPQYEKINAVLKKVRTNFSAVHKDSIGLRAVTDDNLKQRINKQLRMLLVVFLKLDMQEAEKMTVQNVCRKIDENTVALIEQNQYLDADLERLVSAALQAH